MHWRYSPKLSDTISHLRIFCEWIRVTPASCIRLNTRLGPPTTAPLSILYAFGPGAYNCGASRWFCVPNRRYCIETPDSDTASLKMTILSSAYIKAIRNQFSSGDKSHLTLLYKKERKVPDKLQCLAMLGFRASEVV